MDKWFANRGQVVQALIASAALILAAIKAFPDVQDNRFFTVSFFLFALIAATVVFSIFRFISTIHKTALSAALSELRVQTPIAPSQTTVGERISTTTITRPTKQFSYLPGITRAGKKSGVWTAWTGPGSLNAALVAVKNESESHLRNVQVLGQFYDEKHREIASVRSMPWLDEEHDNTGFAPGESRVLLLAILKKETDTQFSAPDGHALTQGNVDVRLSLIIDNSRGGIEIVFLNLATTPYYGVAVDENQK